MIERLNTALEGRYRLVREVGRGGMATVFLAEDRKHDRNVAIKVLDPELAESLGTERFLHEIKTAANLAHPHVLPVYDSGEAGGFLYYVMPYVKGESLRARLAEERQLPVEEAVLIGREVADALAHAHDEGIVHRDVKPGNIMLEAGHAVLADFGLAHALAQARDDRLTRTGTSLGTPVYMSPEQAAGDRKVDGRSDQYALACVIYEMLAGQPPFTGPTTESVIRQHLAIEPPEITELRRAVPSHVAEALRRALSKTPADRFPSISRFAEALEAPGRVSASRIGRVSDTGGPRPDASRAAGESARERAGSRRPKAARNALVPGLVAAGLVGVLALGWVFFIREPPSTGAEPEVGALAVDLPPGAETYRASVAVLPLTNMGQEEDAYLGEGITEEIIAQLAQVPGLKVISRTSVVALAGGGLTVPQIADTLGVDHVLEGSVRRAGEQARITVQLIEAETDAHLWADSYTRELVDLFEVQEEIAREVSRALVETVPDLRTPGPASQTDNPLAYEAYLRGRQALHRRTREGLLAAMDAFERATGVDSTFAPAYAGHAAALALWVTYRYPGIDLYDAYARALILADRSLALDPDNAQAYAARAYVLTKAWAPAERVAADFERAVELQPNSADIHGWYAHLLSREGDGARALREAELAIELDPIAPGRRVGYALDALEARRYDLAAEQAHQASVIQPELALPKVLEGMALLLSGRPEECLGVDLSSYPATEAMCLDALGRSEEARTSVDELVATLGAGSALDEAAAFEELATYHAWIGDLEGALVWLDRSFDASPQGVDYRYVRSGLYDRVLSAEAFRNRLEERRRAVWDDVERRMRALGGGP